MVNFLCCFKNKPEDEGTAPTTATGPATGHIDQLQTIRATIQSLQSDPKNEEQLRKLEKNFDQKPSAVYNVLREEASKLKAEQPDQPSTINIAPLTGPPLGDDSTDWVNCIGEQRCTPLKKVKPQTLQELVDTIKQAHQLKQRVRAVGSGHAFSNIARTDNAVLVNPILLNDVSEVDTSLLRPRTTTPSEHLINVQAGITIKTLQVELQNRNLALINMGGYDGQTLSGTLSTGTHGSGIKFGPLSNFIKSIVLVSSNGTIYQIEPGNGRGITDPTKFTGVIDSVPGVLLKQNSDWFHAAQNSLGCLGVIYSYIFQVTPAYYIRELRTPTTWNDIKSSLVPSLWSPIPPIISKTDHFELVLNPYATFFRHACIKVERTRLDPSPFVTKSGERKDWLAALLEKIAIQKTPDLVNFLKTFPFLSPLVIDQAIMTLIETAPYIDQSFNVFSLGDANEIKAMALELHCDATQTVPVIDKLLKVFQENALKKVWYLAGPLGIRFTAPAEGLIAPQAGRMTCTIELDMLVGVETGRELARVVKEEMCDGGDEGAVRVHWGLDLDFVSGKDAREWYGEGFVKWGAVFRELNADGMFDNAFTDRLGISV